MLMAAYQSTLRLCGCILCSEHTSAVYGVIILANNWLTSEEGHEGQKVISGTEAKMHGVRLKDCQLEAVSAPGGENEKVQMGKGDQDIQQLILVPVLFPS